MPKLESVAKLTEFFETQDMGEYWDELPEVHFEVDICKHNPHFWQYRKSHYPTPVILSESAPKLS